MKKIYSRFGIPLLGLVLLALSAVLILRNPASMLAKSELGHVASLLFDMNRFTVDVGPGLDAENVHIVWNADTVVVGGRPVSVGRSIRHRYGVNAFSVVYGDSVVSVYCQDKYNNWHYHGYAFVLDKADGRITTTFRILGADQQLCSAEELLRGSDGL